MFLKSPEESEMKEISKEEFFEEMRSLSDGFFPPPWNPNEFPEKTEGWIEFQKAMRKKPDYYQSL
jgi:hypothetical protein